MSKVAKPNSRSPLEQQREDLRSSRPDKAAFATHPERSRRAKPPCPCDFRPTANLTKYVKMGQNSIFCDKMRHFQTFGVLVELKSQQVAAQQALMR